MGSLVSSVGGLLGNTPNGMNFQAQGLTPGELQSAQDTVRSAYNQQQNLAQALAPQGAQGIASQTQLSQALQQQAMGQGPNPAAAQLANQTGQNMQQQAAMMAGQRGASENAGLIARQAAQQGAGIQQQAVGQNAVLQAQQQLAAQGQLQNLANTQIGQQSGAVSNLNQFGLQNQNQLVGLQENMNNANAGMAAVNANNTAKTAGGIMNAAGGVLGGLPAMLKGSPATALAGDPASLAAVAYNGGEIPTHMQMMHQIYHGGNYEHKETPKLSQVPQSDRFKKGGVVPGEPKVDGKNTPENDTVNAKLTPKEIVLPLSVTESDDPAAEAAKFVAAIMDKKGGGNKKEETDFKMALKDAIKSRKK